MNPTEQALVHLLACAVRGQAPDPALFAQADWDALYRLAQSHKIDGLLLDVICRLPEDAQPPMGILASWQEGAMLTVMGQALLTEQLHQLLSAFEEAGLRAVVLKGIALKPLYPEPDLRTMSDADLLVEEKRFPEAKDVMEAQGFSVVEQEPGVDVYQGPDGLRVELHARLFDKTAYGFLSRLDEAAMFPISLTRRGPVHGGEAWIFPPKEHVLFMLCHMAKHMITTGFGLRQTLDFILFTEANDATMDWNEFWRLAGELGLSDFASALLELGVRHFFLRQGRWAKGAKRDPVAAEALLLDLLDAGVFGKSSQERERSAAVVYRSYETDDADTGRVRRALFPSRNTLKAPYLYARDHPALLPVAWVHRLGRYLLSLLRGETRHKDTAASLEVADGRLRLLGQLGLRDDINK